MPGFSAAEGFHAPGKEHGKGIATVRAGRSRPPPHMHRLDCVHTGRCLFPLGPPWDGSFKCPGGFAKLSLPCAMMTVNSGSMARTQRKDNDDMDMSCEQEMKHRCFEPLRFGGVCYCTLQSLFFLRERIVVRRDDSQM